MKEKIYKLENKKAEIYKYISAPFANIYNSKSNNVIKNYILEPEIKLI